MKRRNVVRRNTVYAATAFVILELFSIIQEPLRMPEWTMPVLIIFLAVGFIVSIVVSWIYDITPEGNLERTKPMAEVAKPDQEWRPGATKGWKIATYLSFVVILALVVLNVLPRNPGRSGQKIMNKSIAVIPFINDSSDPENEYFINGALEAILDNLSRIEDLRVVSRTSMEQYRNDRKPVPVIAREMNVGYILEGSGQRSGDQVRLFVQLVEGATDKHLWSKNFTREIDDIFSLQSEIARLVAVELQAIITPAEEELMDRIPTTSRTAYDFYQKGQEEFNKFWGDNSRTEQLDRAESLFRYALEYDSTFADVYDRLAHVYEQKYWHTDGQSDATRDSILYFADKALRYDRTLSISYRLKGNSLLLMGMNDQAREMFGKALLYNPNDEYARVGLLRSIRYEDFNEFLKVSHDMLEEDIESSVRVEIYSGYTGHFRNLGLRDLSFRFANENLKLTGDTLQYLLDQVWNHVIFGEHRAIIDKSLRGLDTYALTKDPRDYFKRQLLEFVGSSYLALNQLDSALHYYEQLADFNSSRGWDIWFPQYYGYILVKEGETEKGESLIRDKLEKELTVLEQGDNFGMRLFAVAEIYAYLGEKAKALEFLRRYVEDENFNHFDLLFFTSRLLDPVKEDPEFLEIHRQAQMKAQAGQDALKQWMEENGML